MDKLETLKIKNKELKEWLAEVIALTKPKDIVLCNGSEEEYNSLISEMLSKGILIELNQKEFPGCYLHRSDPNDVARTEHLTFICTDNKDEAGPTNNWMNTNEAKKMLFSLFNGCMKDRTMYIVPYLMGPKDSPHSQAGVMVTDSPYVVVGTRILTRMGNIALEFLENSRNFVKGLHSIGDLNPNRRFICHFPNERLIMSIGSNYGGNAILSKKCHALRIASVMGREEGWLAEHMLIIGIEEPDGRLNYITGAFPSASGKTNLATLKPPASYEGWKVWTLGDDIAWIHINSDGRLWAINPEAGFFGVVIGVNSKNNPIMLQTIKKNTIFTNVALKSNGTPWWEGMDGNVPSELIDWKGEKWKPNGERAAHPNARFTTPALQCPSLSSKFDDPNGVPISAIIFGARRANLTPLVFEAFNWEHGVFVGASMGAETTQAAVGKVGVVRRDPMAMLPFCGYNMADYFNHWLKIGSKCKNPPRIFHVNWCRRNKKGEFLWPGFSENIRVLKWIIQRINGEVDAIETPIGYIPKIEDLDLKGLSITKETIEELLYVDKEEWLEELKDVKRFFETFGDRFPKELWEQYNLTKERLIKA